MNIWGSTKNRWAEICFYSIAGALTGVGLGTFVAQTMEVVVGNIFKQSNANFFLSTVLSIVILTIICRKSGMRTEHFRHILVYPPIFVSIPVSLWIIVGILHLSPPTLQDGSVFMEKDDDFFIAALFFTTVTIVLAASSAIRHFVKFRPTRQPSAEPNKLDSTTRVELADWLSSETPINSVAQDMFNANVRAQRISKALQTARRGNDSENLFQTVVIQGQFGSGKSSVIKLVETHIRQGSKKQFILVSVHCWGFSSNAAQEHILEKAIAALSREVDSLSLRSIPSAYVEAISETSSWVGATYRLLNPSVVPVDHLKRFTPILKAIGAQLVVIIEDTDRNGPDFDQKHIEAMLHNFREVECVSFVLTAGSKSEIEFPKIAEHILFLPPLPEGHVLALLDQVRQNCRKTIPFIDPTKGRGSAKNRPENLGSEAITGRETSAILNNDVPVWASAVASIMNTPRKLKQTLSTIVSRWDVLRGEVDIDELIILTALRTCAPSVFTFFGSHFRDFESLKKTPNNQQALDEVELQKDRINFITSRWNHSVLESDYDPTTLAALVAELVPASANLTGIKIWSHGNRCQSIRSTRGDIYWERLTTELLTDRELRDQDVLSVLSNATDDAGILVLGKRSGESRDFAKLVSFFHKFSGDLITNEHLLRAASIALESAHPFRRTWLSENCSTYEAILRWLRGVQGDDPLFCKWLQDQLSTYVPNHLQDVNFLYHDTSTHLGRFNNTSIRASLVERCRSCFESMTASAFSCCFDKDYPYTLGHLIRLDNVKSAELLTRAEDWRWLAALLLESMECHPEVMVPQVMMLFGDYGPGGQVPTYFNFDESEMSSLFGEKLPYVLLILANPTRVSDEMEGWFRLAAPIGAKRAKDWLNKLELAESS